MNRHDFINKLKAQLDELNNDIDNFEEIAQIKQEEFAKNLKPR